MIYLDANGLYGHSMMKFRPREILDWAHLKNFDLGNYTNDSPICCFLKVHLDYPNELHDLHNDYPLAGKKIKVTKEMLSKYQLQTMDDNKFPLGKNKKNLIPNLGNKKLQTHHQNFKICLNLGLKFNVYI